MTDGYAQLDGGNTPRHVPRLERLIEFAAARLIPVNLCGTLTVLTPSGREVMIKGRQSGPIVPLYVQSWQVIARCIRRGAIGFAESYIRGEVETPDVVGLIRFFARNRERLIEAGSGLFTSRFADRIAHRMRRNTRNGSKRNISAHYDLSNEFYSYWLDPGMTYSAALFRSQADTLADAQAAKYDAILQALDIKNGDRVLEIGCGWGGFAEHLLARIDACYEGITLSKEQLKHADARMALRDKKEHCTFRYQDYRDSEGEYDAIASIEMVEAVGEENWPMYFSTLHARLKPGGRAAVQAITIAPEHFSRYRRKAEFIQRYIFPGGMLPTPAILAEQADRAGLQVEVMEMFPDGYARTLQLWRQQFERCWPEIKKIGFDERFYRTWRYYLAYCEGAFSEGLTSVGIYRFTRPIT